MNTAEERFWQRTKKTPNCWEWTGTKNPDGYGMFGANALLHSAHRFAYELMVGPIPCGLQIDHLCRNRSRVNPAHMEVVSSKENTLRGESFAAVNARKTHCYKGHLLEGGNVYVVRKPPGRGCRVCQRIWRKAHKPWLSKANLITKRKRYHKRKELGFGVLHGAV